MKKFFSLKNILLLGALLLILISLVPKWFALESRYPIAFLDTEQQLENTPIKSTAFKHPEEILQPKITNKRSLFIPTSKDKDIPDVWCIVFNSLKTYKQVKELTKKLEDNKIPFFIKGQEKYNLDPIMSSLTKHKEVIVGPELDIEIINKYFKQLEILGFKGKITKFEIL